MNVGEMQRKLSQKLSMTDKRRAGCGESRKSGSEGGVGKQARDHVGRPKRPAPTLPTWRG
jgi:hypothetical protein